MVKDHRTLAEMPFWDQDDSSLAVSYPPLVHSAGQDGESDKRLKPSLESQHIVIGGYRIGFTALHGVEWLVANAGSLCFLIGSYYFLPSQSNFVESAAILFVSGSVFFTISSVISFIRNEGHTMVDMPLTYNGLLYIAANIIFIAGCVCFMPLYDEDSESTLDAGIILFTIGSLIFTFAPMWNIRRTMQLRAQRTIHTSSFYTELCVGFAYIIGSAFFVVGSIMFLPTYYAEDASWAVGCFIVGSAFFLLATVITSIVSLCRKIRRFILSESKSRDSDEISLPPEKMTDTILPQNGVARSA